MSTKADMAIAFHDKGYNCAQAVACSFCEQNMSFWTAAGRYRISGQYW